MRLTLQSIRTLPGSLKGWFVRQFGEPVSPYESVNQGFRDELKEHGTQEQKQGIADWLAERFGFRKGSLGNTLLVLSVVLTSIFVLHDTISDALISVDKWARPLFLPALWCVVISIHFLVKAAKASKKEVEPNSDYRGDEVEQRFRVVHGEGIAVKDTVIAGIGANNTPGADVADANMTEVASRAAHDRDALWLKRVYKNKSLDWARAAAVCFAAALTVYAIAGWFM